MKRLKHLIGVAVALACGTGVLSAQEPPPSPPYLLDLPAPTTGYAVPSSNPGRLMPAQASGIGPLNVLSPGVTAAPGGTFVSGTPVGTVSNPLPDGDPILSPVPQRFTAFPASLLWEPMLAVKRDPRSGFVFSDVNSRFGNNTGDPSIGTTFGMLRYNRDGSPVVWQLDMFAVVHSRFSDADFLIAADYRAGVLGTARVGNWAAKFGWEHTSTHIGDETLIAGKGKFIDYERDELVFGLSYLYANQFRAYGAVAWSFFRQIDDLEPDRFRYDIGLEWYKRATTGRLGQPFAAVNIGFDGATDYDANFTAQVGWMWKVVDQRLGQFRIYAEFMDGKSPFGQLYNERERYAGFGVMLDY